MKALGTIAAIWLTLGITGCDKSHTDLTKRVSSKCELHGIQMAKTNVPIVYGLIRLNEYGRARQVLSTNSFPHAEECVLGGCILDTPTQAVIYVCSDCQRALHKWENEHEAHNQTR
jgi:hypothetical protein